MSMSAMETRATKMRLVKIHPGPSRARANQDTQEMASLFAQVMEKGENNIVNNVEGTTEVEHCHR